MEQRIVLVGDTGCRMKASDKAFQACNDAQAWPFAEVAQSAAALKPDLVVHVGDIHYRESPCPAADAGCAGSPWGYGYDAWRADLFEPARPLLQAAPWLFVRGNHESCFRAGQGWFRFVDAGPLSNARSCDDPANDEDADYSQPYAVELGGDAQFLVFDSSKTAGRPFSPKDPTFAKYSAQMLAAGQLARRKPHNVFLNHHPLLAFVPGDASGTAEPGGNAGLQSVFGALYPGRLFPPEVSVVMHGHVHLFEAMSFAGSRPASLVLGNSGSANEGVTPRPIVPGAQPFPGAIVEDYAARAEYGFAMLERAVPGTDDDWLLTEYTATGDPVFRCRIAGSKTRCESVSH